MQRVTWLHDAAVALSDVGTVGAAVSVCVPQLTVTVRTLESR
jgi:hypothetical protein